MGRGLCAAGAGPPGVPCRLRGRPLEDLGWGKEEKTIGWGDVGCAGCVDGQASAKRAERAGSLFVAP